MENQHRKIKTYRELSQEEIDDMNACKDLEKQCLDMIKKLEQQPEADQRSIALAKTNIQQGFMWLVRSIAKPNQD